MSYRLFIYGRGNFVVTWEIIKLALKNYIERVTLM